MSVLAAKGGPRIDPGFDRGRAAGPWWAVVMIVACVVLNLTFLAFAPLAWLAFLNIIALAAGRNLYKGCVWALEGTIPASEYDAALGRWLRRDLPHQHRPLDYHWLDLVTEGCSNAEHELVKRYVSSPLATDEFLRLFALGGDKPPPRRRIPETRPEPQPEHEREVLMAETKQKIRAIEQRMAALIPKLNGIDHEPAARTMKSLNIQRTALREQPTIPHLAANKLTGSCVYCGVAKIDSDVICENCGRCRNLHPYGITPDGLADEIRVEHEHAIRRKGLKMPTVADRHRYAELEARKRWPEYFVAPPLPVRVPTHY